jgi:hypothetical protein
MCPIQRLVDNLTEPELRRLGWGKVIFGEVSVLAGTPPERENISGHTISSSNRCPLFKFAFKAIEGMEIVW